MSLPAAAEPSPAPSQADSAYFALLRDILENGIDRPDRTGVGTRGRVRSSDAL